MPANAQCLLITYVYCIYPTCFGVIFNTILLAETQETPQKQAIGSSYWFCVHWTQY